MKILDFGEKENKKVVLIHGFQSPYQVWNEFIDFLKEDYHVIVPILSGHNPNEKEDFISFQEEAKEIEEYYMSRYGNDLYAMFGMSMGGVLAATIWQNRNLHIRKIIFDGSPLLSYNSIIKKTLTNFYLRITHKAQKREEKIVNQAVGSIISADKLEDFLILLDNMSDTTIRNCINSVGNYLLPKKIDTPNTEIYFFHGTKSNEMFAMKTAKFIQKNYSNVRVRCFKGKGHCENSLMSPQIMIKEIENILK